MKGQATLDFDADVLHAGLPDPSEDRPGRRHLHAVDTEQRAADLIAPKTGTWRRRVLDEIALSDGDGLSDYELHKILGGLLYTIAPRRGELLRSGWIVDSGKRRKTNSGSTAIVWTLSDVARLQYEALGSPA